MKIEIEMPDFSKYGDEQKDLEMLYASFYYVGEQFIEGLKTPAQKFIDAVAKKEGVDDIEDLPEDRFNFLLCALVSRMDESSQNEFRKIWDEYKEKDFSDEQIKYKESLFLEYANMQASSTTAQYHHSKIIEVGTKNIPPADQSENIELSPSEILLLQYIDGKSTDLSLPGYFTHEYHIDYISTFERFGKGGYLSYANLRYSLSKSLKINQLKELLEKHNLPENGKKNELVERIIESIPAPDLQEYEKSYYKVTENGLTVISENSHVKYFQQLQNELQISIEEADACKKNHNEWTNVEIALYILKERLETYYQKKSWGNYRNTLYGFSAVFRKGEEFGSQVMCLLYVCYMDYFLNEKYWKDGRLPAFAPSIISDIKSSTKEADATIEDVMKLFRETVPSFAAKLNSNAFPAKRLLEVESALKKALEV